MLDSYSHFFFVGIAGTGMSAIAQYLKGKGKEVSGSDRLFGQGQKLESETQFESMGIHCYFQDGSGITPDVDVVVVSTAIEESNVEYQKALQLNIPIMKRSQILAEISNNARTIAVGGTSGKSTTTAMVFHILNTCGKSPSLITGAGLSSLQKKGIPGNAWVGDSNWLVIESDESDGSIVNYKPEISLLLNIDRDHKEYEELEELFSTFRNNTKSYFIANQDYPLTRKLSAKNPYNFGTVDNAPIQGSDFSQHGFSIRFKVNGLECTIPVIGRHNMENALAAIAATLAAGVSIEESTRALASFEGIYRRAQLVGSTPNNCFVIDDFAHNPAEVAAIIRSCQTMSTRVIAWFQPHGFGPMRFMHKELAELVSQTLREQDIFLIADIYYAGGTVDRNISSTVVSEAIVRDGKNAEYTGNKSSSLQRIAELVRNDDTIIVMGARDPHLDDFAKEILQKIS